MQTDIAGDVPALAFMDTDPVIPEIIVSGSGGRRRRSRSGQIGQTVPVPDRDETVLDGPRFSEGAENITGTVEQTRVDATVIASTSVSAESKLEMDVDAGSNAVLIPMSTGFARSGFRVDGFEDDTDADNTQEQLDLIGESGSASVTRRRRAQEISPKIFTPL
jgi:hypothetical protein